MTEKAGWARPRVKGPRVLWRSPSIPPRLPLTAQSPQPVPGTAATQSGPELGV